MDLFADLTPPQREAVRHVNGPLLVLAAAGSGKTRVITRRVAHLIQSGIPSDQVLALTFTNKAAGEMRERIQSLVQGSRVWVGTFHGFCARLLRSYSTLVGIDRGFTIYDQADRLKMVKEIIELVGLGDIRDARITPERIESAISRAKNEMIPPNRYEHRRHEDPTAPAVAQVYAAYETRLRELSAVDFDDLLLHIVTILKEHKDVRAELDARFRYVLVDEYQDTNLAQYAIVRGLSVDHPNICVTGDPDQSIYGWRGANLSNILEFEQDYPGCRVVKLEQNYRSTKNILNVADYLIGHNFKRKPKALVTENPQGEPIELTVYSTEIEEARAVAGRIEALVRDGEFKYVEIAVFCRVMALTRVVEAALRGHKIPYQVVGGVAFYERQEVKDILAYLSLLSNPKDDLAFARIVNVPARGLGKKSLELLTEHARNQGIPLLAAARSPLIAGMTDRAALAFRDFTRIMDELIALRDHSAEEVIRRLLVLTGYRDFLASDSQGKGEDRIANLDELISAAKEFDQSNTGASISDFLAEVSLATSVDRWDPEKGSVTLMTLHAAKGLEFPIVFIIGLEQGLLPHSRSFDNTDQLEEERRLLFVGITRAERQLFMSRARIRTLQGKQQATIESQFLKELPEGPVIYRDLSGVGDSEGWPRSRPDAWSWQSRRSTSDYGNGQRPRTTPASNSPAPPPLPRDFRLITAADLAKGPTNSAGTSAGTSPAPVDLEAYRPGVSVLHPQFGIGRIVAVEGAGPNRKGRIAFTVGGERTFVLSKAPLRLVNRGDRRT